MTRVAEKRWELRGEGGAPLVVPSLAVLHDLYAHGFVTDDDLVRREGAERWERAGTLPALHGLRERRADPRRVAILALAVAAVVGGLALLLR